MWRRRLLAALAASAAVVASAPASTAGTEPGVTLTRTHDPETQAPGILVTYRWLARFDAKYTARVRLLQDGRLVGQIRFMPGWQKAPAFFRTSSSPSRHAFRATGVLLRRDGSVVEGSLERSLRMHWRRTVQPGQIVR